jgi:hypothetical protein
MVQVKDYSASGVAHVEDFEVTQGSLSVVFENMPETDYIALLDWHVNIAEGMMHAFEMTDDMGDVYMVRFITAEITGENTGIGANGVPFYNVSFELELET